MEKHILIKAFLAVSLITLVSVAVATPTVTDTKTVGTQPAATTVDGQAASNGKIAFVSQRDGNEEIYTMNADGTGQTRLTFDAVLLHHAINPTWSPDGTRIAFASDRDGNFEIYTMNADGTGQTRLTASTADDVDPSWSPDGTRIAFASYRDSVNSPQIYVMNAADGTGQTRLTFGITTRDLEPSWSPDGARIAFSRSSQINVMNADGTGLTALTAAGGINPTWSHDGTKIAFSPGPGTAGEVFVMNADGTGVVNPTQSVADDREPGWSPDGTKIVFTTIRDGNYEIYIMNPDGTEQTRVTSNAISDREPSWQARTAPLTVATITISPNPATVSSGQTQQFTATGRDANGSIVSITPTWNSSNTTVGTINQAGVFTALASGTTTITAASGAVSGTANVTVTSPAGAANGTVTRSFSAARAASGGILTVTLTPGIDSNGNTVGSFYQVIETLPAGVTYNSSTAANVTQAGQATTFTVPEAAPFNYTVTVGTAVANGTVLTFNGTFNDSFNSVGTVTGAAQVTVGTSLLSPVVAPFDTSDDGVIQRSEAVAAVVRFFSGDATVPRSTAVAVVVAFFSPPV